MLYEVLKRTIARGDVEGLQEKIDVFFAAERLTETEYEELTRLFIK